MPACDAIAGRGGAGAVVLGHYIAILGGFAGQECNDVYTFDLTTSVWSQRVACSEGLRPRSVFPFAQWRGRVLALGGEVSCLRAACLPAS